MFKIIFSQVHYTILAINIFAAIFIPLLIISEYVFLEPYLVMHIPSDRLFGFVLIVVVSVMSGVVLSMNVYRIKRLHKGMKKMRGGFFGSIIGVSAGSCSCGLLGFSVASTFGTVGGLATSFLTNYEIPIRIVALAILCYSYYATTKAISLECKIKN